MWLLIDDQRDLNCDVIARTSQAARLLLQRCRGWECVCFDNDLGPGQEEGNKIMYWMFDELNYKPPRIQLVTSNTAALAVMQRKLQREGYRSSNQRDWFSE